MGRTYEIVWADGRREHLEATRIDFHQGDIRRSRASVVEFWGPMTNPDGSGQAGRLLLAAVMGHGTGALLSVRDVEATRPEFEADPPSRWQHLARVFRPNS